MKNWIVSVAIVVASSLAVLPSLAEAKRFGGGSSSGMQRSAPPPAKPAAPQQASPAAAPTAGGAPAAAAAKRSWMGPIAGLAAGLGIAALMSHLGMGEAFGNFLMLALLAVVAVVAIRFLMNRFGSAAANKPGMGSQPGQLAAAGAGPVWDKPAEPAQAPVMQRTADAAVPASQLSADGSSRLAPLGSAPAGLPADFDAEGFERLAKMIFIRMQAANDTGDLNDLRSFTTPEMFAVAKLDLQERGDHKQTTDVVKVDAAVLGLEQEGERQVVSVRFHGLIREDLAAPAADFDEVWHLVRFGDNPAWSIAGIQQRH